MSSGKKINCLFYFHYTESSLNMYKYSLSADVGVIWSNAMEETGEPGGKPPTMDRQPQPYNMSRH